MKVVQYNAITVNGYIAKEDDNVDFVSEESWRSYQEIVKKARGAVVGRRTYDLMPPEEFLDACLYVVLTRNKSLKSSRPNVIFMTEVPDEILNLFESRGLKEVCVLGGGKLNTSFMKEGLVDEIYLDVEPFVFGRGIKLFFPDEFEFTLKLLGVKKLNSNTIQLHYEVKK